MSKKPVSFGDPTPFLNKSSFGAPPLGAGGPLQPKAPG